MMNAALDDCPVDAALRALSGKWRLLVLFRLMSGPQRFNALQRAMAPITQKVLTTTLRALEADQLVWRRSENTVPPCVTYGLTTKGVALAPVFQELARWQTDGSALPETFVSAPLEHSQRPRLQ